MVGSSRYMDEGVPGGWPGFPHLEGRTLIRMVGEDDRVALGPGTKQAGTAFYNPAMAGTRTRSVLLLGYAIERGILGQRKIYALDGLCATGVRARRWINELPAEMAARISATLVDMDPVALSWAMKSHEMHPPSHGCGELIPMLGDFRGIVLDSGRHWVDIDPFGSPVPFLDSAIQSLARSSVLEISATDSAALTGSSKRPLLRRYGARVRTDCLAHDSGLRVLLAVVARSAARHGRCVSPLLSIWDSHHLRVSVQVSKSLERANSVEESIGWRVHSPSSEEVGASVSSGLHHGSSELVKPMSCLLPLDYPIDQTDPRISGPMWVRQLGSKDAMSAMSVEHALEICGPNEGSVSEQLGLSPREIEIGRRKIANSVRNISEEGSVIDANHLVVVDDLASWLEVGAPPSPRRMVELLRDAGYRAGLSNYGRPSFRTDAPWDHIAEAAMSLQPPM